MKTTSFRRQVTSVRQPSRHRAQPPLHGNGGGKNPGVRPEIAAWLKRPKHNLIAGQWVPACSGKLFDVLNPADTFLLSRVPDSGREDIDHAVKAARKAFESSPWRRMTPSERGELLWRVGDLILKNADEFAELESLDNGK